MSRYEKPFDRQNFIDHIKQVYDYVGYVWNILATNRLWLLQKSNPLPAETKQRSI